MPDRKRSRWWPGSHSARHRPVPAGILPARRRALSTCATSVCTCHTGNLADAGSPGVRPRSALRADV